MKKAVITGVRQAGLVEVPDPSPKDNWALVKVTVTPMCTEYKIFNAGTPARYLGHEAVGEVVEVAQAGRVQVGDRVVVMPQYPCGVCGLCVAGDYIHCEHTVDFDSFTGSPEGKATYAQYLLKPDWLLPKIPDYISDEMASLTLCALGPTFAAFEAMQVDAFDTVLITGAGPVGLGGVVNASFRGARIVVVESNPYRVDRALKLGADLVVDPFHVDALEHVRRWSGDAGVDKAVDCSGIVSAQRFCLDVVRRKGQVAFVGESNENLAIKASPDFIRKGLSLHGVWHYNISLFPKLLQVIQHSPKIQQLVSHVLPMSEIQQALEISASGRCAKILLKPWE